MTVRFLDRVNRAPGVNWVAADTPPGPWTTRGGLGGNRISVQPGAAHSGIGGGYFNQTGNDWNKLEADLPNLTEVWMAFWARIDTFTRAGGTATLAFRLCGTPDANILVGLEFRDAGAGILTRATWSDGGNQTDDVSIAAPVLNVWERWELYIKTDVLLGIARWYRNGSLALEKNPIATALLTVDEVHTASSNGGAGNTTQASFDGVAVADERIDAHLKRRGRSSRLVYL